MKEKTITHDSSWGLGCFDASSHFRVGEIPEVGASETLAIAIRQTVGSLGPCAVMKINNGHLIDEFYDELVTLDPDSFRLRRVFTGEENVLPDDRGHFYLNEGIPFHEWEALIAEDVGLTLEWLQPEYIHTRHTSLQFSRGECLSSQFPNFPMWPSPLL